MQENFCWVMVYTLKQLETDMTFNQRKDYLEHYTATKINTQICKFQSEQNLIGYFNIQTAKLKPMYRKYHLKFKPCNHTIYVLCLHNYVEVVWITFIFIVNAMFGVTLAPEREGRDINWGGLYGGFSYINCILFLSTEVVSGYIL